MNKKTARRDTLVYWRYVALWQAVAYLPAPLARLLPRLLGRLWYRFGSDMQRSQVRNNLARVYSFRGQTCTENDVLDAYRQYVRYWVDSFRLHRIDPETLTTRVNDHGVPHLHDAAANGGAVFVTGHLGSWELGAAFCMTRGLKLTAVAEEVKPRRLFNRFVDLRAKAGISVLALRRGTDLLGPLSQAMEDDHALATLLADRDLTRGGPIVSFFGEPCRMPAGPAALAVRTGRPIVAGAFFVAASNRYDGVVRPSFTPDTADLYDITQTIAHELEQLILHDPTQWHVFVPNWLCDREPNHPVVVAWQNGDDWVALARQEYLTKRRRL